MNQLKLTCTLATFNEEENIGRCLDAVKDLADEIVIVDGGSTDDTVKIAKQYGVRVVITYNPANFHINKQTANGLAKGEWILQLDADEVVSKELAKEIRNVFQGQSTVMLNTPPQNTPELFLRHQQLLEKRDGKIGTDEGPVVAYFVPRRNYFLGKFLKYGGTYPDGMIRLFKKGQAYLPAKNVHEQYVVKGRVSWLTSPLLHYDSPTFERYLIRNNRYSSLFADQLADSKTPLNSLSFLYYLFFKPKLTFLNLYVRHKGFLDGFPGLIWAWYSGMTWSAAWVKYWEKIV